jgi:hypothetical protein
MARSDPFARFSETDTLRELARYLRALTPLVPKHRLDPIKAACLDAIEAARCQKKEPAPRQGRPMREETHDGQEHGTGQAGIQA